MRIILTQTIDKLGTAGDICNVAPGYGRNFLLPRGMAILASKGAQNQIEDIKRSEKRRQDKLRHELQQVANRISALKLNFEAKVGEQGRLYGSITAADIAAAIEAKTGEAVDRRKIHLDEPIRTLGEHTVTLHLMSGVDAKVHVEVVPEPGSEPPAAEVEAAPDAGESAEPSAELAGADETAPPADLAGADETALPADVAESDEAAPPADEGDDMFPEPEDTPDDED